MWSVRYTISSFFISISFISFVTSRSSRPSYWISGMTSMDFLLFEGNFLHCFGTRMLLQYARNLRCGLDFVGSGAEVVEGCIGRCFLPVSINNAYQFQHTFNTYMYYINSIQYTEINVYVYIHSKQTIIKYISV